MIRSGARETARAIIIVYYHQNCILYCETVYYYHFTKLFIPGIFQLRPKTIAYGLVKLSVHLSPPVW